METQKMVHESVIGTNKKARQDICDSVGMIIRGCAMDERAKTALHQAFNAFFSGWYTIYENHRGTSDVSIEIKAVRCVGEGDFEPLRKIYEKPEYAVLTDREKNTLFMLGKKYIFLSMDSIELFRRAVHSFPLLSNLKRLLLRKRRGTEMSQCAFVLQKLSAGNVSPLMADDLQKAEQNQNHNNISNETLSDVIESLVNLYEISKSGQFKNTLKVWFNYDKTTQPQAETLYKVAFALRLDHTAFFAEMVNDVQGFEWNVWNEKECIYLFCLAMGLSFRYAAGLIERYHREIPIQGITKGTRAAKQEVLAFLEKNRPGRIEAEADNQSADEKTVSGFLRLIGSLGIGRTYNPLEAERLQLAQEKIAGIYAMLTPETIVAIRSKYAELGDILPASNDTMKNKKYKYLAKKIGEIITIYKDNNFPQFKEKKGGKCSCETNPEHILKYLLGEIFYSNEKDFFKPARGGIDEKTKASLLEYLTDGSCYYAIEQVAGSGFSSKKITQLMNGNATSADRAFFMRLAYLPAVIRFLSEPDFSAQNALDTFQQNAADLMQRAEFAAPNYLYPQDLLLFQSFSARDFNIPGENAAEEPEPVLPPFIYQCFLSRSANLVWRE